MPGWRVSFSPRQTAPTKKMQTTQNQQSLAMREARRRLRLTQFALAKRVGCSESQITKIETGRATPEKWLKEAIARELGVATWEVGV